MRSGMGRMPKKSERLRRLSIYNIMHGCIMRPMPWDHPNFTGSNPNFAYINQLAGANLLNLINGCSDEQSKGEEA